MVGAGAGALQSISSEVKYHLYFSTVKRIIQTLCLFCLTCLNKVMFGDVSLFTAADKTGLLAMTAMHGHTYTQECAHIHSITHAHAGMHARTHTLMFITLYCTVSLYEELLPDMGTPSQEVKTSFMCILSVYLWHIPISLHCILWYFNDGMFLLTCTALWSTLVVLEVLYNKA